MKVRRSENMRQKQMTTLFRSKMSELNFLTSSTTYTVQPILEVSYSSCNLIIPTLSNSTSPKRLQPFVKVTTLILSLIFLIGSFKMEWSVKCSKCNSGKDVSVFYHVSRNVSI